MCRGSLLRSRGGTLLCFTRGGQLKGIGACVVGSGITAGAADQLRDGPLPGPAGDASSDGKIGVVGVRHDDQQTLWARLVKRGFSRHEGVERT